MPRQPRLNIPGALYHVIARGIERRSLFLDAQDYRTFVEYLSRSLPKSGHRCYAWALMPNHFHFLLRAGALPLSALMRPLLTGYAVHFNRRHRRSGYLFQNRFKAILCQDDSYFLELIRYIHLNPVRAKLVKTMEELDAFPWSGHNVLVGKSQREWQSTGEVLSQFGEARAVAISRYREFLRDGFSMGRRRDLTGGGLIRSVGGREEAMKMRRSGEYWLSDPRILGDGEFVQSVLKTHEKNDSARRTYRLAGWTMDRLAERVTQHFKLEVKDLRGRDRENAISRAKGIFSMLAVKELGYSQKAVADFLGISQPSVHANCVKGMEYSSKVSVKLLN